jgi:hypothetical protein
MVDMQFTIELHPDMQDVIRMWMLGKFAEGLFHKIGPLKSVESGTTFSMVKCVIQLSTVWPLTIRNDLRLQKFKKSWEILPKVITIEPFP